MTYFTPSHIASFLYQIRWKIDMEREFNEDYTISQQEVEDIFNSLIIPVENIVKTQKWISSWETSIKSKKSKTKIWFDK